MKHSFPYIYILCIVSLLAACSTTSHLPEGEKLYIGIDKTKVYDKQDTSEEDVALAEVEAALAYAPNGAFLGSSSVRSPLQIGLWTYNALVDKPRSGFNKWLFNSFANTPVTISQVSPDTRVKVANNLLQNYGYFRGKVDYRLVDRRNPKKQKIAYEVHLGRPYLFDSIRYAFPPVQDSILRATEDEAYIARGTQFSTLALNNEKTRLVNAFRNNGFYYYRPDYISYFADSINQPYQVKLLVVPDLDVPERANRQYHIGTISAYIRQSVRSADSQRRRQQGRFNTFDDSLHLRSIKMVYQGGRMPIAPRVLFKNFKFWRRHMFDQSKVDQTLANLHSMDIFSNIKFSFMPRSTDSLQLAVDSLTVTQLPDLPTSSDTLDVRLDLTMDQLIDAEVKFNITQKSNSQVGPSLGLTLSKRNAFYHGETLSVGLKGSYEWQTQQQHGEARRINSYEIGADISLSYPWIAFPWLNKRFYRYPTSTRFRLSIDQLNRANYYQLASFIAEATYGFQTSRSWSHQLSPLMVSYNKMQETSARFDSIVSHNSALYASLRDIFIPAMQYSIVYDNTWNQRIRHTMHFEATVKESANLLNATNALLGFPYHQKDKKLLFTHYSQFLKVLFTLKNTFWITKRTSLATRVQLGAIWTYGNSNYAPYSELFYIGGANSVRAFAVRSIGPGRYHDTQGRGTYLDQSGDMKLELNAEYRFPIVNQLQGALFVDAGNVWLMREDKAHPGGRFIASRFFRDFAIGTGAGLRYDLDFLILRLDLGVGIHAPYDTGKSSYYNIRRFKDAVAFHLAVGYPF